MSKKPEDEMVLGIPKMKRKITADDNPIDPPKNTFGISGWVCPMCNAVWAWWVAGCQRCNSSNRDTTPPALFSGNYY